MLRPMKRMAALVLTFALALSMVPASLAAQTAKVKEDCVRVHAKADIDSECYDQVNKGDVLEVVKGKDENGWVKVRFTYTETGTTMTGYVSADFLSIKGGSDEQSEKKEKKSEEKKTEKKADSSEKKEEKAEQKADSSEKKEEKAEQKADSSEKKEEKADSSEKKEEKAEQKADSSEKQEEKTEQKADSSEKKEEKTEQKADSSEEEEETAAISSNVSYTATVSDEGVRIRKEPNKKSDILTSVPEGDIVIVRSKEDESGWMKVLYYDAEGKKFKGYMSGEYLDINSIGSGTAAVPNTIIRESPEDTAPIAGVVPKDKSVDIYASKDNWYKVEYMDLSGWVKAECIATKSDSDCKGYCKVATDDLNLRAKPNKKSDKLETIPKGVVLQITDKAKKDRWYAVTYNGHSGYVRSKYVKDLEECDGGYVQVTASSLSLRSGAGSGYARLATIPMGKVLPVSGAVGSWYEVKYGKFTGYVSGAFVSATTKDGFSAAPDYAEITADALTLRAEASTDSEALDSIPQGTVLAIQGLQNGWYQVTYNGTTGYVDAGYAERGTSATEAASEQAAEAMASGGEASSQGSGNGGSILSYASQFVGNPYVWGGTSLTGGADCSGFVKSVLAHFGISVPHSSGAIRGCGQSVSVSDMRPGDVVCYSGHVGIYAGNGQLLSALGKKYGITYNSVHYKKILSVRRFS